MKPERTGIVEQLMQLLRSGRFARARSANQPATGFKEPEPWVSQGVELQPSLGKTSLRVRLGLDFGTAYTKLAVEMAGEVFLVDWSGIHSAPTRYLLGGELSEMGAQSYVGSAPGARIVRDLKLPLLTVTQSARSEDLARAAAFLAWALRYARAWLYRYHPSILRGHQLIWEVNLGAPTGSWAQGRDGLRNAYRRIGLTAWRASQETDINTARAAALLSETHSGESGWGLDFLGVVPEFAAQISGYVRSTQRQDGLYTLVDVGAGTLDVACFRIMRDAHTGEDKFPVFASAVEPLGTHYLMHARSRVSGATLPDWQSMARVPTAAEFAGRSGVPIEVVTSADRRFQQSVADVVNGILDQTRREMDRRAPEFARGGEMPVFLVGGGAQVDVYRAGVSAAFHARAFRHAFRSFPSEGAPVARFAVNEEVLGRLSVARGLTNDAESIGQFIPPSEIPPLPMPIGPERLPPDRDELYPK